MTAAPCARTLLRDSTSCLHRQLDSSSPLQALLKPSLTMAAYIDTMLRFAHAYARVEPSVLRLSHDDCTGLPPYRPRLPAIDSDLLFLGQSRKESEPEHGALPARETQAYYLGMRYVLDGSSQGARVISARVGQRLPQLQAGGFAFWTLQQDVGREWPDLCDYLGHITMDSEEKASLVQGARSVFESFIDCFAGRGTP